jgi:hypothetical protein
VDFSNHEAAFIWLFRTRCFERELKPRREYVCSIWEPAGSWNPAITPNDISEKLPSFAQFSHGRYA